MPVSTRRPEPSGNFSSRTVPGAGAKSLSASSALSRASTAWPNSGGHSPSRAPPLATKICSLTRSMPVVASVIGCSTCSRVLTSRNVNDLLLRLVQVLDGAGAAVSGGADQVGRDASKVVGLLLGQYRGAGLLDHLLVAALDGAVAHSRRPDVAVVVGDDLDLDVAGIGDKAFEEHDRVAERALGLALRALECDFEFVGGEHLADTAAAATTAGFDDQRVADGLCVPAGVLAGLDGATAPRCERNAHLLGQKFGLDLVAQCPHRGRRRPDEGELQARAELREGDVFGDETPAHPHRVGLGFQQGAFEFSVVEVRDARRGSAQRHGLVSLAYEHGPPLGVGMKSDCRYAAPVLGIEFAYGPNQAYRGLTPVDHRNATGNVICQPLASDIGLSERKGHIGPGGYGERFGIGGRLAGWCRLVVGRDDGRIDSQNRVARNRAGTETRGENPGRRGDHLVADRVVDCQRNARRGGVAHPLDVEIQLIRGQTGGRSPGRSPWSCWPGAGRSVRCWPAATLRPHPGRAGP